MYDVSSTGILRLAVFFISFACLEVAEHLFPVKHPPEDNLKRKLNNLLLLLTSVSIRAGIIFVPAKAANAGGVAVSGMEMTQNSMRLSWTREELDRRLHDVMDQIHERCLRYGTEANGYVNYRKGANISGFIKVADAIRSCGIV